ncbi:hypothetical protein COLO4_08279 [Corchorus olitorius]|uniref:Uncharacterized protein n=1 Tax=Corchorus olitorius TaxID=93759 RepID=A0A1R3KGJ6_9ROSI|nr:hypothetical protein COLO4_08279 [Corchorus olitorius]
MKEAHGQTKSTAAGATWVPRACQSVTDLRGVLPAQVSVPPETAFGGQRHPPPWVTCRTFGPRTGPRG